MNGLEYLMHSAQRLDRWRDHHGIEAYWAPYGGGLRLNARKGATKATVYMDWASLLAHKEPGSLLALMERDVIAKLRESGADIPMPQYSKGRCPAHRVRINRRKCHPVG